MRATGVEGVRTWASAYSGSASLQVFDALLKTRGLMAVALVRNGKTRSSPGNDIKCRRCVARLVLYRDQTRGTDYSSHGRLPLTHRIKIDNADHSHGSRSIGKVCGVVGLMFCSGTDAVLCLRLLGLSPLICPLCHQVALRYVYSNPKVAIGVGR